LTGCIALPEGMMVFIAAKAAPTKAAPTKAVARLTTHATCADLTDTGPSLPPGATMNIKTNLFLAIIIIAGFAAAQELRAEEKKPTYNKVECEVWNREKSFAMSVENHDAKAFAEHLEANAVFVNGDGSFSRGRDAVTKDWSGIIEGKNIIVRWNPDFVSVSSDGKSAISRGPFWMENPNPQAKEKYRTGTFQSTWVKNKKGQWHVFIDGGTPPPKPATAQQVQALQLTFSQTCPQSEQ
ncbi:MAG: YybH family protein, partial [Arenimonas sp.]